MAREIVPVLLLALTVAAEKKIELQDIEEDNLKSEKGTNYENVETRVDIEQDRGSVPIEYLNSGLFRYFKSPLPTQATQQQRYIQQYDVTEPQEGAPVTPAPHYGPPSAQRPVANYVSNVPVQFYLVPQYQTEQVSNSHTEAHYSGHGTSQVESYPTPETEETQSNYIEGRTYITPTAKTYIQPVPTPVTYVSYSAQPTIAPATASISPVLTYQLPVVQYHTAVSPSAHQQDSQHSVKVLYETARHNQAQVEGDQENVIESQNYLPTHTDVSYTKSETQDIPRYYNSRTPLREEYTNVKSELPHPSPLLLKAPPPHLAHLPKALPVHRPWGKSVYSSGVFGGGGFSSRPNEPYGPHLKRRPTSLLDSYIPSSIQIEYLKRGIIKDPLVAYEALSRGRHFGHPQPSGRHFESGFLPNQMFHTSGGGTFYGHYKRSPKVNRGSRS
ncbi:unnamed protein product, partial [Iphiclides podalirius]